MNLAPAAPRAGRAADVTDRESSVYAHALPQREEGRPAVPGQALARRTAAHSRAIAPRRGSECGDKGPANPGRPGNPVEPAYWQTLCVETSGLLLKPHAPRFLEHLRELHAELVQRMEEDADLALFALTHLASLSPQHYSATHALLCAAILHVACLQAGAWSSCELESLTMAALTMNLSITAMQDELAACRHHPDRQQRPVLERHARSTAALLRASGVTDPHWLHAVEHHHDAVAGPLRSRTIPEQMARLLQRADLYAVRLSPRLLRQSQSAAAAAYAAYIGEDGKRDDAGMLMVNALGRFPPGCYVRLDNGELGCVVRRSAWGDAAPIVAVFATVPQGVIDPPAVRDTALEEFTVDFAFAPKDVSVALPFAECLRLAHQVRLLS